MLISEVDETEIFKICLEYWNSLVSDLYRESPFVATVNTLYIGKSVELPPRRLLYIQVLSKVIACFVIMLLCDILDKFFKHLHLNVYFVDFL